MVDSSTADQVAGRGVRGWFGDRRVSTKILSAVLTGCVVAVAIGLLAVTGLAQVASTARDLYQHRVLPQSALADLRQSVTTARLDALAWHTARSEATAGQSQALLAADEEAISAAVSKLTSDQLAPDEAALVADFSTAWKKYGETRDGQGLALARAGN